MLSNNYKKIGAALLAVTLLFSGVQNYKLLNKNKKLKQENIGLMHQIKEMVKSHNVADFYHVSEEEKNNLKAWSKSQLQQDIFAYLQSGKKTGGFFVEFGATDGESLSNSHMLEKHFGWKGILAEPAKVWHDKLKSNRPNSTIEHLCVWKETGATLTFNQTDAAELSTISIYNDNDSHKNIRKNGQTYDVSTITLVDLLKKHNAPQEIDYLSIDTEGSELDILEAFFKNSENHYKIKIISCEHNFTENREKIYNLLKEHGYERKLTTVSAWDDFYVLKNTSQN